MYFSYRYNVGVMWPDLLFKTYYNTANCYRPFITDYHNNACMLFTHSIPLYVIQYPSHVVFNIATLGFYIDFTTFFPMRRIDLAFRYRVMNFLSVKHVFYPTIYRAYKECMMLKKMMNKKKKY